MTSFLDELSDLLDDNWEPSTPRVVTHDCDTQEYDVLELAVLLAHCIEIEDE